LETKSLGLILELVYDGEEVMADLDFDVHFGVVDNKKVDWRSVLTKDEPDDDEELAFTPEDVVGLLGFDPKDL
jgi:hypothetical protein